MREFSLTLTTEHVKSENLESIGCDQFNHIPFSASASTLSTMDEWSLLKKSALKIPVTQRPAVLASSRESRPADVIAASEPWTTVTAVDLGINFLVSCIAV